jgi:ABC-type multidrug transport system fused ATPase/permease subunit
MTINNDNPPNQKAAPTAPAALPPGAVEQGLVQEPQELTPEQRRAMIAVIIIVVLGVSLIIISIAWLANQPPEQVALIRDIFIIYMAIMSLLISLALVILMIQIARLMNLLQNEIKPILDSINETISHLRGTTVFLGDNLAEPVIKANEYFAGFAQLLATLGLVRRASKSSRTNQPKESE